MAISISEQYPGKTAGNTTDYPFGEARNVTAPGDGTGTPWEQAIVNDDQGFKQALLAAAGVIPSGTPDTASASQYLQALKTLFPGVVAFTGNATQWAVKLKFPDRTLCIKGGNVDYASNPGEISVTTTFSEAFPTLCATVVLTRKMNVHSNLGDGVANLVSTSPANFVASLNTWGSGFANVRGFSWIAFGW